MAGTSFCTQFDVLVEGSAKASRIQSGVGCRPENGRPRHRRMYRSDSPRKSNYVSPTIRTDTRYGSDAILVLTFAFRNFSDRVPPNYTAIVNRFVAVAASQTEILG